MIPAIKIVLWPDPVLTQVCEPVTDFEDIEFIVADLRRALELSAADGKPGFGLSAPQIGIPLRVFVIEQWPDPFVNPELTAISDQEFVITGEACLSLPPFGTTYRVARALSCKTVALNADGNRRTRKHRGLDARIVQHEMDHLDGILISTYSPPTPPNVKSRLVH